VRLTVLGCSGSGPGPTSPASSYLLTAGDDQLLLDLGNGSFGPLQRHLDPWEVDAVALSHLHADHCADMTNLVVHRRYHPTPPADVERLPVYAPTDAPDRLAAAYAASREEWAVTDLSDVLAFRPIAGGGTVGGMTLRAAPVDHPVETYALRVEHDGTSLVYSGDTGPCAGLVELARGADLLLCEASWPHVVPGRWSEPPAGLHLSGRQAGEAASAAGVGRLLLTHVPVWCDPRALLAEARASFDGPVELAAPDVTYDVRRVGSG
jgi:ribonuclease BN (tRNA processing enzyme)